MRKMFLFACLAAATALAGVKSYNMTLFEPATVGSTELKAGDYKFELQDQKIVIKHGKQTAEANVRVENSEAKYNETSVSLASADGKNKIQEIHVGGTHMKLVLD